MKIKKYVAETMPEAMEKIRSDLGSDAVILNSKEIMQGGFLGLFKRRKIEVIAALDPQPIAPISNEVQSTLQTRTIFNKEEKQISNNTNSDVLTEIKHMKRLIEQQSLASDRDFSPDYELVFNYLLDQEVDRDLAKDLINSIVRQHEVNEIKLTSNQIVDDTKREIESRLGVLSFEGITHTSKIIQFIGPTGVGKTTTLAKVAANSMLNDKKSVAFITADTYRIAAIDQLKTYAQILDVPIEVAYTIEDYKRAIEKFSTYDLILVDTAGRNFRDNKYVNELKRNINLDLHVDMYLVLSLTAKPKDISEIYNQFHEFPIKQIIFTKIDETTQYGSMLNITLGNEVGVAYLTNGQDVPDDLICPTPVKISEYVFGGYYDT